MTTLRFFRNRMVIWTFILVLPPLGFVLLWASRGSRVWAKLAGTLASVLLGILHFVLFWNLRVEFDGSMMRPIFSFRDPARHSQEIDKLRLAEGSFDASRIQSPPHWRSGEMQCIGIPPASLNRLAIIASPWLRSS